MLEKLMKKFIQNIIKNPITVYLGWWLTQSIHILALVLMVELTVATCCGSGVIEIKCPYKYRHVKIEEINDSTFYLLKTSDGLKLNPNHEYFYQVQMQMAIILCDVKYCDFVVWTMQGIVTNKNQCLSSVY